MNHDQVYRLLKSIDDMRTDGTSPLGIVNSVEARLTDWARQLGKESQDRQKAARPRIMTMAVNTMAAISDIADAAGRRYNLRPGVITSLSRQKSLVYARHVAMWAAREVVSEAALMDIGSVFQRDHSTVLYAVNRIATMRSKDERVKADTDAFLAGVRHV